MNEKELLNPNYRIRHQLRSGAINESKFVNMIKYYAQNIYRNKHFPTCLTNSGSTEIDIIFCYKDTIFILEAKNIIALEGKLYQRDWRFVSKTANYIALNPILQNKVHVRAFKNSFFTLYHYYPDVKSFVVVPNNACYDKSNETEILTLTGLNNYLFKYENPDTANKYLQYQLKRMF